MGGCGKTTLAENVAALLRQKGKKCQVIKGLRRQKIEAALSAYPGPTEQAWVCNLPVVPPKTETFAMLGLLSELEHQMEKQNDHVLIDHYIDSVFAQVLVRNNLHGRSLDYASFSKWFFSVVAASGFLMPKKTFFIDLSLDIASDRSKKREKRQYSKDDYDGFSKIASSLKTLQQETPNRIIKVDGRKKPKELASEVVEKILND